VPSASELFGADSPDFNFSNAGSIGYNATNGTCYSVDDNSFLACRNRLISDRSGAKTTVEP
jgi:hypothetical protein